jgi:hypothetical protein
MPVYFAGWVLGNAGIRFGSGFSVTRLGLVGGYRITIPPTPTNRFLATTVTPVLLNRVARVVQFQRNLADGTSMIDVEIRDLAGTLADSEFNFIAVDRSGS